MGGRSGLTAGGTIRAPAEYVAPLWAPPGPTYVAGVGNFQLRERARSVRISHNGHSHQVEIRAAESFPAFL